MEALAKPWAKELGRLGENGPAEYKCCPLT